MCLALRSICVWVLSAASLLAYADEQAKPLRRAHAHNDYLHDRPLHDALQHGFCSVEADVFLVEGELLVAHTRAELDPSRTLEKLYLEPLRRRVQSNGGRVHQDGPVFTLLIDIKSDGEATYDAVNDLLSTYKDIFSYVDDGNVHSNAVWAVISGNRAKDRIAASSPRFAGIDGRLTDLSSDQPAHLIPMISDNWRSHFGWRGDGSIPAQDREKLERIVDAAHAMNRTVRFWATPDIPPVWDALNQAGVDLINTDDLSGLQQFLQQAGSQ